MSKPHNVQWNNIGLPVGLDSHYELCDLCKKDCSSKIIRTTTEKLYIIKCSEFECREEYKEGIQAIDEEFIAKHRD